jgi:hypothetical protein
MIKTGFPGFRIAVALLPLALYGCQSIDVLHLFTTTYPHGKVALCPSAASIGPAVIVVTDTAKNHPGVQTVPRDTPPEGVCAALNDAAIDAGFQTVFDDQHNAGVQILAKDPDQIKIDSKNVRIVVQQF